MIKMGFTILFCVKYMYCYSKHFVAIVFHERIVMFSYFLSVLWCFTTFHIVSMKEQNFYHFIIEQTNLCLHVRMMFYHLCNCCKNILLPVLTIFSKLFQLNCFKSFGFQLTRSYSLIFKKVEHLKVTLFSPI